ncbi:MAG: hypothetical protein CL927_13530 [Deltaproteobacteria bacterium]|nr:hypothetical protein [Deltaproteobacteria bacterium]HCH65036.1 hypothetical protein [Deltaproteobacteria bacterium]
MLTASTLSQILSKAATPQKARGLKKHISPLRGVRGAPGSAMTEAILAGWKSGVHLDEATDVAQLKLLFSTAFEDGLVAVGLAAAATPDDPESGLELCRYWLSLTDDIQTADALGWLMWMPALLSGAGKGPSDLLDARNADPFSRRAAVIALLAALPVPIEGPSAAGLRARLEQRRVAFVDAPLDEILEEVLPPFLNDSNPQVRKGIGRVVRTWAASSPDRAEAAVHTPGGLHRVIRDELEKGLKKGRRPTRSRR